MERADRNRERGRGGLAALLKSSFMRGAINQHRSRPVTRAYIVSVLVCSILSPNLHSQPIIELLISVDHLAKSGLDSVNRLLNGSSIRHPRFMRPPGARAGMIILR